MDAYVANTKPNNENSLSKLIYEQVKNKIIYFEYEPDSYLTEAMLAQEYQVSKMPVKLAVRQLENEGWLIADFRRKIRVKNIDEKMIRDIYAFRFLLESNALDQVFKKQAAVEYSHILEEKLQELRLNRFDSKYSGFLSGERDIHLSLIHIFDNERIDSVYGNLQNEITRISTLIYYDQRKLPVNNEQGHRDSIIEGWGKFIDSLREKDYEQTRGLLHEHISYGLNLALSGLAKWNAEKRDR